MSAWVVTMGAGATMGSCIRRLPFHPKERLGPQSITWASEMAKHNSGVDDTLLPSTSNAVERGNRRYRKLQNHVYRVRTQAQLRARLALDMWREAQAEGRQHTLASLHQA